MPKISKTRKATIGDAQVMDEMAPQPTSVTSRFRPKLVTMAEAAGETADFRRLTSRLMPTKPQVMVMPLLNALEMGRRKIRPMMVMIIGSMT